MPGTIRTSDADRGTGIKYRVRCMCGDVYPMTIVVELVCWTCGARLIREGEKCRAIVADGYDLKSKPYKQPGIYT